MNLGGSGAFMQNVDEAKGLATSLVNTANAGGVKCEALITRMDYPLGIHVGNCNEVWECVECLLPGSSYMGILEEIVQFDKNSYYNLKPLETPKSSKDSLIFITAALALNMVKLCRL